MMLMSRPGNLPVYSHKATTKADIETEKQDSPETESPKSDNAGTMPLLSRKATSKEATDGRKVP